MPLANTRDAGSSPVAPSYLLKGDVIMKTEEETVFELEMIIGTGFPLFVAVVVILGIWIKSLL